jgi:tetratricopeptide (TPR) repeat protein
VASTNRDLSRLRVVVVSPGDVMAERDAVVSAVEELDRRWAQSLGWRLSVWRWETDARPGLHLEGPQGLIDERMEIADADVVVGIFWKRFGTPTHDAGSGTEHELRRAWEAWRERGRPDVMVYFSQQPAAPAGSAEIEQWLRVARFREELPKEQLWWPYGGVDEFERLVRRHLEDVIQRRAAAETPRADEAAAVARSMQALWFGVPPVVASFTGRDRELAALEEALSVADRAVITQAVTGLGGVGKTQLAARYVQTHAAEYDLVAWIGAEDGGIAGLAELAGKLGEPVEGLSPIERRELALERLRRGPERWLLVLDNVESAEQLRESLPRSGQGRVLVTSRNREVRQFAPLLALDVFDPATAADYLTERAGRVDDRAGAERLARALGYLPLALSHAAAYCATGTSFDAYLDLLDALPAEELFSSNREASHERTVASTWKASMHAAIGDASLAAEVLAVASHLAPDAIPKSLFGVLIDPERAVERKRLGDAFNALAHYSLATVDDQSVSVHRLLQKVVRDDAQGRAEHSALRYAVAGLAITLPDDPSDASRWPLSQRLLAHVLAVADAAGHVGEIDVALIDLLNRACLYLNWAGDGARALALAQSTAEQARRALGPEHPSSLTTRCYLAVAQKQMGHISEAIAIHEPLLAMQERILGPEHPDTLATRNDLAGAYWADWRLEDSIAIYEPLLATEERILGPEHPDTLTTRSNLAIAYRDAGRKDEAIAIHEQLLATQERILGPEHAITLATRLNLAGGYHDAARVEEAIAIYEPLLATQERILGPEHPLTLSTRHALALAYRAARRVEEAIAIYEPLLATRERILGPEHPDTLSTRLNLAGGYQAAGRVEEAVAIYGPLLATQERILGPEHALTLATHLNLAGGYHDAGRIEEAIAIYEPLLATQERIGGPEHALVLVTRTNLAAAYEDAGRVEEAIAIYEPLLATEERILGPQHPLTLSTRHALALAYRAAGRVEDAEAVAGRRLDDAR